MDSFYASVEARDRPELRGKPIAVGGSPEGRGVIATSSYEARAFGVTSAMSSAQALRLCPRLILIRPDFAKYKAESRKVRAILERYAHLIEPLSLDEAYLDVTDNRDFGNSATRIAAAIRDAIRSETGLTASAGIAANKFLAKVASPWNKPDGQKTIGPLEAQAFVLGLPIEKIWGVGKVTAAKMRAMGLRTCADLQKLSLPEMVARFGSWGTELYGFARGEDDRPVKADRSRKSLSVETTFAEDRTSLAQCAAELENLYADWDERLQRARLSESWREEIRGISIKLKFYDFQSITREKAFSGYPKLDEFRSLLQRAYESRPEPVRLIGLGVKLRAFEAADASVDGSPASAEQAAGQLAFSLE